MTAQQEPLAELLRTVVARVEDLVAAEERVRSLLDAVNAVAGDLELHATLERIVVAAAGLADAQYAALGVIDPSGEGLIEFVTHGLSTETVATIGAPPRGHGILGLIIHEPSPLRLEDLGMHPASYGFPDHHPPMRSFLGVPVRVRDRVFGNLYLTDKRGSGGFTSDDEHAVSALAATAAIAIENARLFERLSRRERWLAATAEIQQALLGHVDAHAALSLIAAHARDISGAVLAAIVLEDNGGTLKVEAVAGPDDQLLGAALPKEGALADVVDHGATVILAHGVLLPGLEGLTSAMLVPFTGPGGAGGALIIGSGGDETAVTVLDDEDVQALRGFAAQAALGVDRAQAQEDRATLAILEDRDRIARDLHDLVIQRLFATGLTLQSMARRRENSGIAGRLTTVVHELDATIRDIRGAIFELNHDVATFDLKHQIIDLVAAAEPLLGSRPHVDFVGPVNAAVDDSVRSHLIAVLVEALSNAGRHADAAHLDIGIRVDESSAGPALVLEIRDDGKGFTPTSGGSGLRNMRDRADDLGGHCDIVSTPGEGTTIRWTAPLNGPPIETSV